MTFSVCAVGEDGVMSWFSHPDRRPEFSVLHVYESCCRRAVNTKLADIWLPALWVQINA